MFIKASSEKREIRPRSRSLTRGFGLCPAAGFDQHIDRAHQIGVHAQARGFFGCVGDGVPDAHEAPHFRFVHHFL